MTREEAKQAIDYYYCHTDLLDEYGDYCDQTEYEKAFDMALKALSSSEKPNKWIPVSERLPEKRGDYLITQKSVFSEYVYISVTGYALNLYDVDEYDFADKKRSGWYNYDPEYGYYEIDDVIAWMPLVEPYKEVQE